MEQLLVLFIRQLILEEQANGNDQYSLDMEAVLDLLVEREITVEEAATRIWDIFGIDRRL